MKKKGLIFLAIILSSIAFGVIAGPPSPRKKLRQAEKLVGDFSKIDEARKLFKEVLDDSTYIPDAHTYFVGADIERGAYKHYYKLLSINRNDKSVDRAVMADALINAYRYSLQSMALDSVPDKKGVIKVKYSPDLSQWISENAPSIYNAGIAYLNKNRYDKAYTAFLEYANLPDKPYYTTMEPMSDSIRATVYFYSGVMAYKEGNFEPALVAFDLARKHGYVRKEVFLNQISCLSNLARLHPENRDSISYRITRVAHDGLSLYSVSATPVFIQKYVAGMLYEDKPELALVALDTALIRHPNMTMLLTMKAGVYATMKGKEQDAAETYILAASDSAADATTLKTASKYLAKYGIEQLDNVSGRNKQARKRQKEIRQSYLQPSLDFAQRAIALLPEDEELLNVIETVSYRLI
ncbi:MAG: hypothetical protein NC217_01755 [Muribaculaceae bacterium]|nr:hypothetical protein [Muribaculaceae bacterium]